MLNTLVKLFVGQPARGLNHLQDILLAGIRLYVGWQFLKAGWLKLQSWDSTIFLFQYEYQVPLLSPTTAAVLGTLGEVVFPILLFAGLAGRLAALGLSIVNVVAVLAYAHVIFSPGFEASVADHYLWGLMLVTVMVFGPGKASLDFVLNRLAGDGGEV